MTSFRLLQLPRAGSSCSPGLGPGLGGKTAEEIKSGLSTPSADTLSGSVSAWMALKAEGAEDGCVGGAGRKRWVGRVLLPSLKGYKRKSGLRGKAVREVVIARAKYLI